MWKIKDCRESILVFIHIKKTAGISLQLALAKQFGTKFYGGHSHNALKALVYHNEIDDLQTIPNGACVCKHWPMSKFDQIEHRCNFITVLRHPLDRIISHYNFYRLHHNQGQDVDSYIRDTPNINVLSNMIDRNKLCEFYLFEHLEEDLAKSEILQFRDVKHLNITKRKFTFSRKQKADFLRLNKDDLDLYEWALSQRQT